LYFAASRNKFVFELYNKLDIVIDFETDGFV